MGNRSAMLQALQDSEHDLLVIGGGITGAGVAREASLRGLSTALVERRDFACGTSSRSTKLVHGGLRYLRNFDFGLVREAVSERQRLLAMAPHLVNPMGFLFPVYKGDPDGRLKLHLGLTLYDWFAGKTVPFRHKMLDTAEVLEQEPTLKQESLRGGALYVDSTTDDSRLTLSVLRSALHYGAVAANYLEVTGIQGDRVELQDGLEGKRIEVRARQILNATGPWADNVRHLDDPTAPPLLRLTKGVHITVGRDRLPIRQAVTMRGPDDRVMFAVPSGEFTYIGTTDTDYTGPLDDVSADATDVAYILEAAARSFDTEPLKAGDVVSTWAGLRPLLRSEGDPSRVSRDYHIYRSVSGLVTIAGGKLTAFRSMASHIVDELFPGTREKRNLAQSTAPLPGDDVPRESDLAARVRYAVEKEMAVRLEDFFRRRTGLMLFSKDNGRSVVDAVAEQMASLLDWSRDRVAFERDNLMHQFDLMFAWRTGCAPGNEGAARA